MVEAPIPQDILKHKSKLIANLSARELIFAVLGGGIALFCFFSIFFSISEFRLRGILSAIPAIPFFLIGFCRPYEQPFEKIAWMLVYDNFICPPKRLYEVHHPEYEKWEKGEDISEKKTPYKDENGFPRTPTKQEIKAYEKEQKKQAKIDAKRRKDAKKPATASKEFKGLK